MTTDMNIKQGAREDFALVESMGTSVRVGYGLTQVEGQDGQYKWHEVTLYKKQHPIVGFDDVKAAIIADIDARTDERILSGYQWTLLHGDETLPKKDRGVGTVVNVWLSKENQTNYKAKYDLHYQKPEALTFPCVYKIGETDDKEAIFETFETFDELEAFYLGGIAWIEAQVGAGWAEKKAIDWAPYQALFPASDDNQQEAAAE